MASSEGIYLFYLLLRRDKAIDNIRRNSKEIPEIFARAKNVRVYSQTNHFSGRPLADDPIDPEAWPKEVKHTTPQDFLAKEFMMFKFSRLVKNDVTYTLRIHSNLWYEFEI